MSDDPYGVLGVRPDASADEVRKAYVRLARQHHPDYFLDATARERAHAEARMRAVNEAWALLGDPAKRRAFDAAQPRPFRPFQPVTDDEPDPRDQPDIPYRPAPTATAGSRLLTVTPAALFAGAVGATAFALVVDAIFLAVALVLLLLAGIGFVALPLLALTRARRDEG